MRPRGGQTTSISVDDDEYFEYHLHDDTGDGEMPPSIRPQKRRRRGEASRERAGQVCSPANVGHCTPFELLLVARA